MSEDDFGYTVVYENTIGEDDTIDFDDGASGVEMPTGGSVGNILIRTSTGARWEAPAESVEQDNTRPVTSAAVYAEVGNIKSMLATLLDDPNLKPEYIKRGVTILGVTGTYDSINLEDGLVLVDSENNEWCIPKGNGKSGDIAVEDESGGTYYIPQNTSDR